MQHRSMLISPNVPMHNVFHFRGHYLNEFLQHSPLLISPNAALHNVFHFREIINFNEFLQCPDSLFVWSQQSLSLGQIFSVHPRVQDLCSAFQRSHNRKISFLSFLDWNPWEFCNALLLSFHTDKIYKSFYHLF